jgi:hypothetical protein
MDLRAAAVGPLVSASLVALAGWLTPGYDPALSKTVSRLAVPGAPAALLVDAAIGRWPSPASCWPASLVDGPPAGSRSPSQARVLPPWP